MGAAHWLPIVGAPHFHDGSARDWCVKRCPLCATCYLHTSAYEYLVNGGSEDEVTVTRLAPDEAATWLARVDEVVRERRRAAPRA